MRKYNVSCVVENRLGDRADVHLRFIGRNLNKCNGTAVREAKKVLPDAWPFKVFWTRVEDAFG